MQEHVKDSNIFTIDALYHQAELAAIHLIREGDKLAIVDTGTQFSVPQVAQAIESLGLSFSNVEYIILTHIHLDHAGGASSLMDLCENAQLLVHEKGAKHIAQPDKLVAGATAVYGEEKFSEMYGQIKRIDPSRIASPADLETVSMGNRTFKFIDSPGHANHHFCIVDIATQSIFTGDTMGVAYRQLREPGHAYVLPTTTPVQFNPQALHNSIDRVMAEKPEWLYYTHYSSLRPTSRIVAGLHEQIDDYVALTQQVAETTSEDTFETTLAEELFAYSVRRGRNELETVSQDDLEKWLTLDSKLSAQGLAFWWQYRR